jgi:hypothetical protein
MSPKTQNNSHHTPRVVTAICATSQILEKFRNDSSPTTAPAGWPKSDCNQKRPEKYGASMAAKHRIVVRTRGLNSWLKCRRNNAQILRSQQPKIHDAKIGFGFFGKN